MKPLFPLAALVTCCALALASCAAPAAPDAAPVVTAAAAFQPHGDPRIVAPPVVVPAQDGGPFSVDGVLVVNRQHPLTAAYVPPWSHQPRGLHPDLMTALTRLMADAKREGVTLVIRSAYRSYAEQGAIFTRELKAQPGVARQYFAEAGKSEHQTGLGVDLWDGRVRGYSFAKTKQAAWLADHAWEYGFIIRYPDGRTDVTGYAYEPWHLRYVGTDISVRFGPRSTMTLEEYLGLA